MEKSADTKTVEQPALAFWPCMIFVLSVSSTFGCMDDPVGSPMWTFLSSGVAAGSFIMVMNQMITNAVQSLKNN